MLDHLEFVLFFAAGCIWLPTAKLTAVKFPSGKFPRIALVNLNY